MDEFEHFRAENRRVDEAVGAELGAGEKRTHWMWFVFPQRVELGMSPMAKRFGLDSLARASRYAADPELGPQLRRRVALAAAHAAKGARAVMGYPDDMKLRSSLTLFALACPGDPAFEGAMGAFFGGAMDPATVELCAAEAAARGGSGPAPIGGALAAHCPAWIPAAFKATWIGSVARWRRRAQ